MWTLLKIKLIRQQLNRENVIWFNRSVKTNRHFKKRVTSKVNNFKIAGSDQGNVPSWWQQTELSLTVAATELCHLCAVPPPFIQLCSTAPTHCNPGHGVRRETEKTCTGQHLTWPGVYWLLPHIFLNSNRNTKCDGWSNTTRGFCINLMQSASIVDQHTTWQEKM